MLSAFASVTVPATVRRCNCCEHTCLVITTSDILGQRSTKQIMPCLHLPPSRTLPAKKGKRLWGEEGFFWLSSSFAEVMFSQATTRQRVSPSLASPSLRHNAWYNRYRVRFTLSLRLSLQHFAFPTPSSLTMSFIGPRPRSQLAVRSVTQSTVVRR